MLLSFVEIGADGVSGSCFWHPDKITTHTPIQARINCNLFFIMFILNGYKNLLLNKSNVIRSITLKQYE
jgi:hypothetical protein